MCARRVQWQLPAMSWLAWICVVSDVFCLRLRLKEGLPRSAALSERLTCMFNHCLASAACNYLSCEILLRRLQTQQAHAACCFGGLLPGRSFWLGVQPSAMMFQVCLVRACPHQARLHWKMWSSQGGKLPGSSWAPKRVWTRPLAAPGVGDGAGFRHRYW